MGWTVDVEHSSGTVTFDSSFSFLPRCEKKLNERTLTEYVDIFFNLKGRVVAATPALVAERTKELFDLVATQLAAVSFTVSLDGTEMWSYTPGAAVAGPVVVGFTPSQEAGSGGSNWGYELELFVRMPGNNFSGLNDLRSSLVVTTNVSKSVTRKVWEVSAKARTITAALQGVMRFKPSGKVSEEIRKDFDQNMVSAVWVWNLSSLTFDEHITVTGGGRSYIEDKQAGVNRQPILHLARRGATIIRLEGVARGLESEGVEPPAAHWKESSNLRRQFAQEVQSFPTYSSEEDRQLGIVTLPYSEIYIFTGEKVPAPNHGTHASSKTAEKVPSDGAINR